MSSTSITLSSQITTSTPKKAWNTSSASAAVRPGLRFALSTTLFVVSNVPWPSGPFGPDGQIVQGSIEVQTRVVLESIQKTLAEADCTLADVVKNTIWLEDPRDFAGFNKVYAEFFAEEPPARATVRADLMLDAKIEIESLAYKPLGG